jgi:hypothetical protein
MHSRHILALGLALSAAPPLAAQDSSLCVLDFEATDPGVLVTLQDAAMPTQWWVECAELSGR